MRTVSALLYLFIPFYLTRLFHVRVGMRQPQEVGGIDFDNAVIADPLHRLRQVIEHPLGFFPVILEHQGDPVIRYFRSARASWRTRKVAHYPKTEVSQQDVATGIHPFDIRRSEPYRGVI